MDNQYVRLLPRKAVEPLIKGNVLRPSAGTQDEFTYAILDMVREMTEEVSQELRKLFSGELADVLDHNDLGTRILIEEGLYVPPEPVSVAMDASIAGQASKLMARMMKRFTVRFNEAASVQTKAMIDRTLKNSEVTLKGSLKDVAKTVTLDTSVMTDRLKNTVMASTQEAAGLIKRIPQDYIGQVQGDVMRSITSGNGLQDLIPALEKQNVTIKNWAKNVAMDQTRKAYGNINKDRMQAVGVKKFEWVHSGGSAQPRPWHKDKYPNGLSGGIFSFDDLPVIDPRTGERGIPGQAPYCRCTMRPIISFDTED